MERLSIHGRVLRNNDPNWNGWLTWVTDPGTNNLQDTFAGGEPTDIPVAVVDLSAAASSILGQQVVQSAKYRLRGVTIGYRAHDGGVDNESDAAFQGQLRWFADTDHFREAMSLARQIENNAESDAIDLDSALLSTDKDYSAMRMDFGANYGGTRYATAEDIVGVTGGTWNLLEVANAYNVMTAPDQSNALFNGRFPGYSSLGWNATISSGAAPAGGGEAQVNSFVDFHQNMFHEVGMGLLQLTVTHSTIAAHQGMVEDDYQWWVGFDFEVSA